MVLSSLKSFSMLRIWNTKKVSVIKISVSILPNFFKVCEDLFTSVVSSKKDESTQCKPNNSRGKARE